MNTLAQQRLAALDSWFTRNSRWGTTPNGGTLIVGKYASVVPCSFEAPPFTAFDIQSLICFVDVNECDSVSLSDFDPNEPIDAQHDIADRLEHCLFKWEDGLLSPCIIVGLDDALEPIAAAVARAGLAEADLSAFPVLATPLWPLSAGVRYRLRHRLPFVPKPGAGDPDMPADFVSKTIVGVSDRWP